MCRNGQELSFLFFSTIFRVRFQICKLIVIFEKFIYKVNTFYWERWFFRFFLFQLSSSNFWSSLSRICSFSLLINIWFCKIDHRIFFSLKLVVMSRKIFFSDSETFRNDWSYYKSNSKYSIRHPIFQGVDFIPYILLLVKIYYFMNRLCE